MVAALAALAALAACGGQNAQSASTHGPVTSPATTASGASATVWLCRPGMAQDPCEVPTAATVAASDGARTRQETSTDPGASRFDCFYVYPTVSTQPGPNANLDVQSAEIGAAAEQASRFSTACQVWAPMYRQRTSRSLRAGLGADPQADAVAYRSLLAGWRAFLAQDRDDRPIVLIGHSQGAAMLIRLLQGQIGPDPTLRSRIVLAIIAGGNVTVPPGAGAGGAFAHIPLCSATVATRCVIAYSSFPSVPPGDSEFGRPGQGVSLQWGQTATAGLQVACVNPADLSGGAAELAPYFLAATQDLPAPKVTTPWVTYPDLYRAECQSSGGATWLQVTTQTSGGRPVVSQSLGPTWGYHEDDINLALGNLVQDVQAAEAAYSRAQGNM